MKIENEKLPSYDHLNKLDQELKRKIIQKEAEIKRVDNLYDKKIDDEYKTGEESYINQINLNKERLNSANHEMEQRLKDYSDHLSQTKMDLDRQIKNLEEDNQVKNHELKSQFENNYIEINENARNQEINLSERSKNSMRNIDGKSKDEISKLEDQSRRRIESLNTSYNQKSVDLERDFRTKLAMDIRDHQAELIKSKDEFKKNAEITTEKNKRLESEKLRVQADELKYLDDYHKNLMEQKNKDFKIRFENLSKGHEATLKNIKTKLDEEVYKLQLSTSKDKKLIQDKKEDSFYNIEKLNPRVSDIGNSYVIELEVTPHEKENVHLVANGRNLKLTLNRRFNETIVDENGVIDQSSRNQLYSKEMKVADLLNPKKVESSYENNILKLKIAKL